MKREEITEVIQDARRERGLTWKQLAETVGRSPVWTTAALLGQMQLSREEAERAGEALGLDEQGSALLQTAPTRGESMDTVPVDPTIYRFYELLLVYGPTWKALIHEEFGDGIMSAIDFEMSLERQPDPKGDRVKLVMSGKFLPYKKY